MPPKRKHRADDHSGDADADAHDDAQDQRASKRFAMLKPRVRRIAQGKIKAKWTTLPESAQDRVHELFRSVEMPVITRHRDERKRIEAQSALAAVKKNLGKRLPRMPFPPGTKDISFDYEAALHENRALATQATTTSNSIRLLQAEIKREEAELGREKARLEELDKNAKAARAARKKQSKNVHPVLRRLGAPHVQQQKSSAPEFSLAGMGGATTESSLSDMATDPDLRLIVTQLRDHLESMQNNTSQVAGIREAVTRAQAALSLLPSR